LSEGSTKSHPGHGLGLSVARACADLIGGAIEVVEGPGVGAHFRVQFPADEVAAGGESAEASNEFLFDVLETF
jgi:signal transduction histidine kinase